MTTRAPKSYDVPVVGEQHYRATIASMAVGDVVWVRHEPHNPHDPDALVCLDAYARPFGYIPRDNFLQRVFHEDGKGAAIIVAALTKKPARTDVLLRAIVCRADDPENSMLEPDQKTPLEGTAPVNRAGQMLGYALGAIIACSIVWNIFA